MSRHYVVWTYQGNQYSDGEMKLVNKVNKTPHFKDINPGQQADQLVLEYNLTDSGLFPPVFARSRRHLPEKPEHECGEVERGLFGSLSLSRKSSEAYITSAVRAQCVCQFILEGTAAKGYLHYKS